MSSMNNQESVLGDYVLQLQKQKEERERKRREQEEAEERKRREEEERQAAKARRLRLEEEERLRAEQLKKNMKWFFIVLGIVLAVVAVVLLVQKRMENKRLQIAIAEAKAYIVSGDSCVAIYHFGEALEFYKKAKKADQDLRFRKEIIQKEMAATNARKEAEQKAQAKQKQVAKAKAKQHKTIDNPEAVTRDPGSNDQQSSNSSEQSTQNPNINEPVESKSDEMASKKATGDGRYTILTNDGYVEIPPDNEIWYTTTDGKAVTLNNFNGQLIYHNYSNGRGIYRFKDSVNKIVSRQFNNTEYLTVILPQSVQQIDSYGFNNCSSLRSIILSRRLRQIGTDVFCNISAEIYFLSPVPQMGWRAMWNLRSNSVIYYPTNEDYSSLINDFPSAPVQEAHAKMRFKAMNY